MSELELCRAIKEIRRVEFLYKGKRFSVDPYIVYIDKDTGETLLDSIAAERRPPTSFRVADITDVALKTTFLPIVFDSGAARYEKTICLVEI